MYKTDISLTNVSKYFGYRKLFYNLNLHVLNGQLVVISGNNGSGKTSLLRIMAGLEEIDKGQISYNQQPMPSKILLKNSAFLAHRIPFYEKLSVIENSKYFIATRNLAWSDKNWQEQEEIWQIGSYRQQLVEHLSAGTRQKIALAWIYLSQAPFCYLDEPLNSLDQYAQKILLTMIKKLIAVKRTVILATHQWSGLEADQNWHIKQHNVVSKVSQNSKTDHV